MSGSDETNIRLWKAEASEKLGKLRPRERVALRYAAQLRHRYAETVIAQYAGEVEHAQIIQTLFCIAE